MNSGSAPESLLLTRYSKGKLASMLKRFDADHLYLDARACSSSYRCQGFLGALVPRTIKKSGWPNWPIQARSEIRV